MKIESVRCHIRRIGGRIRREDAMSKLKKNLLRSQRCYGVFGL